MSVSDQEYEEMKANAHRRGRTFITIGLFIVAGGLAVLIWGFTDIGDVGDGFGFITKIAIGGFMTVPGIIVFAIGMYFYMASKMDKITKFYSRATGPAMKYTTEKVTDGFASGLKKHGMSLGGSETITIKCRNCGYLETEDAEFCSKCGQTM